MAMLSTRRSSSCRLLGVMAVVALALVGPAPVPARAAGELVGGSGPGTAVPLPLAADDPNATIGVTNAGVYVVGTVWDGPGPSYWNSGSWYSYTPTVTSNVYLRATSVSPPGWDNTIEVWTGGAMVAQNDDSYGLDAALMVTLDAGTTYDIVLGAFSGGSGTVSLTFSNHTPSAPQEASAVAGDGSAAPPARRRPRAPRSPA